MSTANPDQKFFASSERQVNTHMEKDQRDVKIATLAGGGYIIVWESTSGLNDGVDVYGQRYDAGSNPVGGEFLANSYIQGLQSAPDVVGLADGGFVIAWYGTGEPDAGIHMQLFNADRGAQRGHYLGGRRPHGYRQRCTTDSVVGWRICCRMVGTHGNFWELTPPTCSAIRFQRRPSNGCDCVVDTR